MNSFFELAERDLSFDDVTRFCPSGCGRRMAQRGRRVVMGSVLVALATWMPGHAQDICGRFETVPGSTVLYSYMPGTNEFETLPVEARFDISCTDYSLQAELLTPIIGVDEDGNPVFPTGLTYPVQTQSVWDPVNGYMGVLQGTAYNYGWTFSPGPDDSASWDGFVSWFGGRYEETTISDVRLESVPEPGANVLLVFGVPCLAALGYRVRYRVRNS